MKAVHRLALKVAYQLALIYWRIFRPTGRGAYVAVWHDGCVLAIRNSYKPGWTLPAGGVGHSESVEDAAARELLEEVGILVDAGRLQPVDTFVSRSEYKTDQSTVFEVEMNEMPLVVIDEREVIEAEFISFEQLAERKDELAHIVQQYVEWKLEGAQRGDESVVEFDPQLTHSLSN